MAAAREILYSSCMRGIGVKDDTLAPERNRMLDWHLTNGSVLVELGQDRFSEVVATRRVEDERYEGGIRLIDLILEAGRP
jgi:hypothetical protein